MRFEGVDWSEMTQDRFWWQAFVAVELNFSVP